MTTDLFKRLVNGDPQEQPARKITHVRTAEEFPRIRRALLLDKREQEQQNDLMLFVRLVQKNKQ